MSEERCDLVCLELPRAQSLRAGRLPAAAAEGAAAAARALGDPTRLVIAALLRDGGELCVCDLAWLTGRAINVVSHHLKALRIGGLVEPRRDGRLVLYTLTAQGRALTGALLPGAVPTLTTGVTR